MANTIDRPTTPTQQAQLITPPSTAGVRKRVRFSPDEDDQQHKRVSSSKVLDEARLVGKLHHQFEHIYLLVEDKYDQCVCSDQTDEMDPENAQHGFLDSLLGSGSGTSVAAPLVKYDCFAALALAIDAPSAPANFDFLRLPKAIRQKIYTLLTVVPALVCVRQNVSPNCDEPHSYLFAERRQLLTGISYVLTKASVDNMKSRFFDWGYVNAAILRVSRGVFFEAAAIMYRENKFELANLSNETSPPVEFSTPLFPRGYESMIRNVAFTAKSMYGFRFLMKGGHHQLERYYSRLDTLTLVLEIERVGEGYGRILARLDHEGWVNYVKRIHNIIQMEIFECKGITKSVPISMNLRVLFSDDSYVEAFDNGTDGLLIPAHHNDAVMIEIKSVVAEAFELFKKGGY